MSTGAGESGRFRGVTPVSRPALEGGNPDTREVDRSRWTIPKVQACEQFIQAQAYSLGPDAPRNLPLSVLGEFAQTGVYAA